jgi:drug/metabolite transporter (DMT)-like permease
MTSSSVVLRAKNVVWHGWGMAFFAILFFSVAPPITKYVIILGVEPGLLLAIRYVVSTLLLFSTIAATAPDRLRIDRRGLWFCIISGILFGSAVLSFTWSLTRISASVASIIVALYPLVVLGLLAFRGERFTYRNIIRLALGLGGVYLLVGPGGQVDSLGVLLVIGTCFAFALYLVFMQWFLKDYRGQTVMLYVVATITVFTSGLWVVQGAEWKPVSWQAWLGIGALVLFGTYVGQLALFAAVRQLGSGQMALLNPVEPFLTVIWSYLFLQERLTLLQWSGGILILLSMLLAMSRLGRVRRLRWRARLRLRF